MYKMPLRLTTLHLAQRFLIDEETFTYLSPSPARSSMICQSPILLPLPIRNFDYTISILICPE